MTPGELKKIADSVADLLARESNDSLTAEELATEVAEKIVFEYEAAQAKSYNLIVLAHFTPGDGSFYTAAVGPLSTRAVQRARSPTPLAQYRVRGKPCRAASSSSTTTGRSCA